jgi:hypothetical protein
MTKPDANYIYSPRVRVTAQRMVEATDRLTKGTRTRHFTLDEILAETEKPPSRVVAGKVLYCLQKSGRLEVSYKDGRTAYRGR